MEPPYQAGIDHPDHLEPAVQTGTGSVRITRIAAAVPAGRWSRPFGLTPLDLGLAVAVLLAVVGVIWLVYEFVAWLFGLLAAGAGRAGDVVGWLLHGPVTGTVTEPVRTFLRGTLTEAAGEQLWRTWLAVLLVLFIAAVRGSRGGRIGWVVLGLATAYMTWRAGGEGAAVTTVLLWALLSVPAFAGSGRAADVDRPVPAPGRHHPSGTADAAASTDAGG